MSGDPTSTNHVVFKGIEAGLRPMSTSGTLSANSRVTDHTHAHQSEKASSTLADDPTSNKKTERLMQRDLVRSFAWLVNEAVRAALRRDPSLHTDIGGLWLEGLERLARCAKRFDPERGVPFEWFVRSSLQYLRLARGVRTYSRGGFDSELIADEYDNTPTPEDWLVVEEAIRYLSEESPYLSLLIRKRISGATYQKIVEELGKALSTLHRDHTRAVDRLKYHGRKLDGERVGPRTRDWGQCTIDPQLINQRDDFTRRAYRRFLVEDEILDEILKAMEKTPREEGGEDEL